MSRRSGIKTKKLICAQCKLEINEQTEDNIACDKCKKSFHAQCSKLDKRQFELLVEDESVEYKCHMCEGGENGTIKEELTFIKTKLNQLDQLSSIHDSITFLSKQYDDILKTMVDNRKKLDEVKKENLHLKEEIKHLKTSVKNLNDEKVKNHCIIMGLKPMENLSAADAVVNLSKDIGVDIEADKIEDAYFLKNRSKTAKNTNVIVKFNTKSTKDKLMAAKSKLKNEESSENKVFINDLLSKETLALLNHAKVLKTVGYKFVYPNHGRIFVKRSEISRPRILRSEDDVDGLLLEATTNKKRMSRSFNRDVAEVESSEDETQTNFMSPAQQ